MINYEMAIPELLREKFDIKQLRGIMYHSDRPYGLMPHVLFFLEKNEKELNDYKQIEVCMDSFKGRLAWVLRRAFYSEKNYIIMPEVIYQIRVNGMNHERKKVGNERKVLGDQKYNEIYDLAIEDIPDLYEHMKKNL